MTKSKHNYWYSKTSLLLLCFFFIHYSSHSQYISSTVEQVSAASVLTASLNNPIIRIKIEVGATPITLFGLFISTTGTTNPSGDIDSAKIFYTTDTIFNTSIQYGTSSAPNSGFTVFSTIPLPSGINYFWVTYDIVDSSNACDTVDASCYTVYGSMGTATPTVTDPPGYAIIGACPVGIGEENIQAINWSLIYPNPALSNISLEATLDFQNAELKILNVLGAVQIQKMIFLNNKTDIDVSALPSGIYFIQFNSGKQSFLSKFVKQ